MAAILHAAIIFCQARGTDKKSPAFAVYRQVLNLHVQVGPYLETPPWLRPIALFLIKLRTLLVGIGSKREGNITNKEGLYFLYHTTKCEGRYKLNNKLTTY